MMNRVTVITVVLLLALITPAHAQLAGTDTIPGSTCAGYPPGATRITADADEDGSQVTLICDGSVWRAASGPAAEPDRGIQFNSGGSLMADPSLTYTSEGYLTLIGPDSGILVGDVDIDGTGRGALISPTGFGVVIDGPGMGTLAFPSPDSPFAGMTLHHDFPGPGDFLGVGLNSSLFGFGSAAGIYFVSTDMAPNVMMATGAMRIAPIGSIFAFSPPLSVLDLSAATDALILPVGSDGDRPASPVHGMIRYNSGSDTYEGYVGGATNDWVDMGGGSALWADGTGDDIYYNSGTPQVGIGTNAPDATLDVVGDINYTSVIVDVSDIRLKENVRPLQSPLQKLTSLNGFAFEMKGDPKHQTEYGVSAQDVQRAFPELVHEIEADGTLGVSYNGLIAPIIEAIKELKVENEMLRARLDALEQQEQAGEQGYGPARIQK